jgi:hypothetical protein
MSSQGSSNAWDDEVIVRLITRQRLWSYLSATGDDPRRALELYEWNLAASGSVLALVAMVEVMVRNVIDESLREWSISRYSTPSWFTRIPLDDRGRLTLNDARRRAATAHPSRLHGQTVAELSFGFWRYLVASKYHTKLWIPAIASAFPCGPQDLRTRRSMVEDCLQRLLFVRNRAAHHEPIHRRDLLHDVRTARTLAAAISQHAAEWIAARQTVTQIYSRKPSRPAA